MDYAVEIRFLKDKRYAVAHKIIVPPEEHYVEKGAFAVITDIFKSLEQAKDYCNFLVQEDIVDTAVLIGEPGNDGNDKSDSGDNEGNCSTKVSFPKT